MSARTARTLLVIAAGSVGLLAGCGSSPPGTFSTPEQAGQALAEVIGTRDVARVEEIFGPGSVDLFRSGDEDADGEDFARVKELASAKLVFEDYDANTKIAMLGENGWPWPIPLVLTDGRWRFDTAVGREELLNRRIGSNELWTLTSLHATVDAQREYASQSRDGAPPAFAQKFISSEGRRDGLYWPLRFGEESSPLGDLLADSEYLASRNAEPRPYHGYHYRMLTSYGGSSGSEAKSYLNQKGLMTGGFAVIAWPAKYGNSGVMTFLISHNGIAYQKDLGPDTDKLALEINTFDPDITWSPTGDSVETTASDPSTGL